MNENIFDRLSKNNNHLDYLKEFDQEMKNSSERGIVLISASIIEKMLEDVLRNFLIDIKETNEMFSTRGTLGTFDSKIKLAFSLGLITKSENKNLKLLQKIRNKFAHQIVNISFDDESIKQQCLHFKIPKDSFFPKEIPLTGIESGNLPIVDLNPIKDNTSPKNRFLYTFKYLYFSLYSRLFMEVTDEHFTKRKPIDGEFTSKYNIYNQNNSMKKVLEKQKQITVDHAKSMYKQLSELESKFDKGSNKESELKNIRQELEQIESEADESYNEYLPLIRLNEYIYRVISNSTNLD